MATQKEDTRTTLTVDEAISVLPEGEDIHTFRGGGMAIIGADWSRSGIEGAIREAGGAELTGPMARGMKHGIALNDGSMLFIATDEAKLAALEAAISAEAS
jgi:hypothetical protein